MKNEVSLTSYISYSRIVILAGLWFPFDHLLIPFRLLSNPTSLAFLLPFSFFYLAIRSNYIRHSTHLSYSNIRIIQVSNDNYSWYFLYRGFERYIESETVATDWQCCDDWQCFIRWRDVKNGGADSFKVFCWIVHGSWDVWRIATEKRRGSRRILKRDKRDY